MKPEDCRIGQVVSASMRPYAPVYRVIDILGFGDFVIKRIYGKEKTKLSSESMVKYHLATEEQCKNAGLAK
jgi:hypothetical protein